MYSNNSVLTSTGDSLAIALVLNIAASEDTFDAGEAGTGLGDDVAILIELKLTLDQSVRGVMSDSVEETVGLDNLLLVVSGALHTQVGHEAVGLIFTEDLGGNSVEADCALGVLEQAVGHDFGSAQLVTADKDGNVATVLSQEHGLLGSGITTTNHVKRLVAEDGHSAVTDSTRADAVLPVLLLARQVQATGVGASGDDHGVGSVCRLTVGTVVPLGPHLERSLRQIQLGNGLSDDLGTETLGLGAHLVHQLGTADTVGETGEVLDVSGGGQLATGGSAVGEHTLIENRLELGARKIDGSRVGARAGADDCAGREKRQRSATIDC